MNICRSVSRTIAFLHRRTATEMQKQRNFMLYASTSLRIFISPLSVFFRISYLFPSLFPPLSTLSSSADGFSLDPWRRLHSLLSDLHNCIDEQCCFNNVTNSALHDIAEIFYIFRISTNKDASTACIFIIPILCETDVYYDQLWQNVGYFNALLCCHLAEFFYIFFALAYVIS